MGIRPGQQGLVHAVSPRRHELHEHSAEPRTHLHETGVVGGGLEAQRKGGDRSLRRQEGGGHGAPVLLPELGVGEDLQDTGAGVRVEHVVDPAAVAEDPAALVHGDDGAAVLPVPPVIGEQVGEARRGHVLRGGGPGAEGRHDSTVRSGTGRAHP